MPEKHPHQSRHGDKQFFIRLLVSYFFVLEMFSVGLPYMLSQFLDIPFAVADAVGFALLSAMVAFFAASRCFKNIKTFGSNAGWKTYYIAGKIHSAKSAVFTIIILFFIFAGIIHFAAQNL